MFKFICNNDGKRLDAFLADSVNDLSRTQVQKMVRNGRVLVNGLVKSPSYSLKSSDVVELSFLPSAESAIAPLHFPLEVIYEDKNLVLINKPPFISVHPVLRSKTPTIVNALVYRFGAFLSSVSGPLRPGIVHRLDKNTSGCLLVAKNNKSHEYLSRQFKMRRVKKIYTALVRGKLAPRRGTIMSPVGRSYRNRKKMSVHAFAGRDAVTHYEVLKYFDCCTLLNVRIETGRTHQIRVHLSAIGHPVVGDDTYGNKKFNKGFREKFGLKRQFLHASKIGFTNLNGKFCEFEAPLCADLENVLTLL